MSGNTATRILDVLKTWHPRYLDGATTSHTFDSYAASQGRLRVPFRDLELQVGRKEALRITYELARSILNERSRPWKGVCPECGKKGVGVEYDDGVLTVEHKMGSRTALIAGMGRSNVSETHYHFPSGKCPASPR